MNNVIIRDKQIGDGNPPYFVAELGICHQGSVEIAKKLVKAAKESGADCIKTETFQRENIVFDDSMTTEYTIDGKNCSENLMEHMFRFQLTFDEHAQIKKLSDELGLPFMSTAHDFEAVDFLVDIGAEAIKISSADIIHYPLIRYAAKAGLVLFIDTSGALQYEIEMAYKEAVEAGAKGVIFNHHPGGHPATADQYNLRIIQRLKSILNVPIGTADHYGSYEMVYAAVAVGANAVEKPVSLDRFIKEPEHIWSISIADLPQVISNMHFVHQSLGVFEKKNIKESKSRVCIVAAKDLKSGSEINFDNVLFGRPNNMGVSVRHWDIVEGRKLKTEKKKGEFIKWADV
ncbi:MAG: N-acetylneuraminate synthase family protein [Planctomycetes bacterium]|nr:N-acetylneuraminate synthase family protein [Planctomycetota bacterium]